MNILKKLLRLSLLLITLAESSYAMKTHPSLGEQAPNHGALYHPDNATTNIEECPDSMPDEDTERKDWLNQPDANVNYQLTVGTPLVIALRQGEYHQAKFLIENGANLNFLNRDHPSTSAIASAIVCTALGMDEATHIYGQTVLRRPNKGLRCPESIMNPIEIVYNVVKIVGTKLTPNALAAITRSGYGIIYTRDEEYKLYRLNLEKVTRRMLTNSMCEDPHGK